MSLYDVIFDLEMILCERFPNLDPLTLSEYRAVDVFTLVRNLNLYSKRENETSSNNNTKTTVDKNTGKRKTMIRVMDS